MALTQSFPALKSDATYQRLMQQLEGLENDILERRENYNKRVKSYNAYRNGFPVVLVAQKLAFNTVDYFDSDDNKFEAYAQTFMRDDTAGLQEILGNSKKAFSSAANQAVKNISQGVSQLREYAAEEQRRAASEDPEHPNPNDQKPPEKP